MEREEERLECECRDDSEKDDARGADEERPAQPPARDAERGDDRDDRADDAGGTDHAEDATDVGEMPDLVLRVEAGDAGGEARVEEAIVAEDEGARRIVDAKDLVDRQRASGPLDGIVRVESHAIEMRLGRERGVVGAIVSPELRRGRDRRDQEGDAEEELQRREAPIAGSHQDPAAPDTRIAPPAPRRP